MKNKLTSILILLCLVSCSDEFIETESLTQISEENFFSSESDAVLALNAVYSSLQSKSLYGGNLNGFQGFPGFDGIGDNAYTQFEFEGPALFMEGTLDTRNGFVLNIWTDLYRGIARANSVIVNVGKMSEDIISAESKNNILGQALFLRALFYFNLAVYFEEAPLITTPQTLQEAFVPKNSFDEIVAQITEDLKFAITNLPEVANQPSSLFGQATKGSALGLFARMQLYNKIYDGEFGVLNLTQQIMSMGYTLHPNYAELFTIPGERSSEIVFSVRFLRGDDTNNGETFSSTFLGTPKVDQRPMANLVRDYYATDGLPIDESPLFNPANEKANRDPRALATIYFRGDIFLTDLNRAFSGNSPTGYGMRKYIRNSADAEGNAVFAEGSQDFYVIRYADVLLMRAEALAETGDISGAAALVTQVRARVGMPAVEDVEGNVNQSQMISIVRHERRVELALEGLRFMDLKRWNQIEQGIQRASSDPVGPYSPQFLGGRSTVFPIPQDEIDVNPQLLQNPVWQ
jgi:hypothetical protein